VTLDSFIYVLVVGAALLAMWLAVRVPRLAPRSRRGYGAALAAVVAVVVATPWLVHLVGAPLGAFAAIFLVVLPAFTYVFLATIWLLQLFGRLLRPS
jgi:uncharacterized membrane protein